MAKCCRHYNNKNYIPLLNKSDHTGIQNVSTQYSIR